MHLLRRYRLETGPPRRWHLCRGAEGGAGERALSRLALLMSASYLNPRRRPRRGVPDGARRIRNPQRFRRRRGERPKASRVGYHLFDAETGTLIVDGAHVALDRDCRAGRIGAGAAGVRPATRTRPLPGAALAPARERLLVLRRRLAVPADRVERFGSPAAQAGAHPRDQSGHAAPRARAARPRPCVPIPGADHLAQPRPDPRDGAARHSGPLPRLFRRGVLDRHQPLVADAHVLFRLRRGDSRSRAPAAPNSRSTSSPACCPGCPSAKPPAGRRVLFWSIEISSGSWCSRWKPCR